jgi:cytochrome oxidase assembly protein ShyY1
VTTRFWLRPKWIFGHLLCLFLVVLFINLGFWQLRRLHEKRVRNDLIHQRERATPASLDDALRGGPSGAVYRRVRVTGHWDAAGTVLVRSRALDEVPGYAVLTPLVTDDQTVIVNRGFTQLGGGGEAAILATVRPRGDTEIRVDGILRASEKRGSFGPKDVSGHQTVVNRIDVTSLEQVLDRHLAPVYLQLLSSSPPPPGGLPRPFPLPATDEGPHLSYAGQWFIFATVGAVGWPLLLRKTARDIANGTDEFADENADDDGEEPVETVEAVGSE